MSKPSLIRRIFLKRWYLKWPIALILLLALLVNLHVWKFTHFTEPAPRSKLKYETITWPQKAALLFTGIDNPKSINDSTPSLPFETVTIPSRNSLKMEGWLLRSAQAHATVILYHGYRAKKSSLIAEAEQLHQTGYQVLLVDFLGHGGSEGFDTQIGYGEAEDVYASYLYAQAMGKPIILYGVSMGAASVMRAMHVHEDLQPQALVLSAPFASLKQAIVNRFHLLQIPPWPMADFLIFCGGAQHGYNAHSHNPVEYARSIKVPTLLLHGKNDKRVIMQEADQVLAALQGPKELVLFEESGHTLFLQTEPTKWKNFVGYFLAKQTEEFRPNPSDI